MDHLTEGARIEDMSDSLALKLGGFFAVSEDIRRLMRALCADIASFAPGEPIVDQGADYGSVYLVESGWVIRSRVLESGARQIVNVAIPGDFVALNALLFRQSDFAHVCKTPVSAFRMEPATVREALSRAPALASALFWVNAHEASILAERIVSLGRRSARERAAHVLCEFIARLEIIRRVEFPELAIPISQEDFADILGISPVHMNKVLRGLERDGVVTFRMGVLMVHNRLALERIAGFDHGYLHFTRRTDILTG